MAEAKNALINYFQESYQELKKVTWPTRNQSIRLTFIVLGFCLVTAAVIGVIDLAFNTGYRFLIDYAATVNPPELVSPTVDNIDIDTEPAQPNETTPATPNTDSPTTGSSDANENSGGAATSGSGATPNGTPGSGATSNEPADPAVTSESNTSNAATPQ